MIHLFANQICYNRYLNLTQTDIVYTGAHSQAASQAQNSSSTQLESIGFILTAQQFINKKSTTPHTDGGYYSIYHLDDIKCLLFKSHMSFISHIAQS